MDLFLPAGPPVGVILFAHGGAFYKGDKSAPLQPGVAERLAGGWAVASVNYRLVDGTGANAFPAGLQDLKLATRFLRVHGPSLGVGSGPVVAWGHSAGGALVEMLGATSDVASLEPTGVPADLAGVSSRPDAVVSFAGPSDLVLFNSLSSPSPLVAELLRFVRLYAGCRDSSDCAGMLGAASVAPYVSGGDPPIFAAHGAGDALVPPEHGYRLLDASTQAGSVLWLDVVDTGDPYYQGHNLDYGVNDAQLSGFLAAYAKKS